MIGLSRALPRLDEPRPSWLADASGREERVRNGGSRQGPLRNGGRCWVSTTEVMDLICVRSNDFSLASSLSERTYITFCAPPPRLWMGGGQGDQQRCLLAAHPVRGRAELGLPSGERAVYV